MCIEDKGIRAMFGRIQISSTYVRIAAVWVEHGDRHVRASEMIATICRFMGASRARTLPRDPR
jgi:hypothetical protein